MDKSNTYIAIIIAAGLSSRMDGFKPLLDIGGKPALFRLLDTIITAGIGQVIVVTGYKHELIEDAIERYLASFSCKNQHFGFVRLSAISNEEYECGMFSSIKLGIRHAAGLGGKSTECMNKYTAALLFPVDVPLVCAETVGGLIRIWEDRSCSPDTFAGRRIPPGAGVLVDNQHCVSNREGVPPSFAVPVYEGKNGHPLLIPHEYFAEILCHTGEGGLKKVRQRYDADMIKYVTNDAGCILDMDTKEDYARLLEYYEGQNYART